MLDNLLIMWYSSAILSQEVNFMKDVKQAQQFATAERAESARYNLPKTLKNIGYHVQFVGMAFGIITRLLQMVDIE